MPEIRHRRRWKGVERDLAKRLGGERVPVSGRTRGWVPDIRHPWLAIEVKSRLSQLVVIREMMDQAIKAAGWYQRRGEGDRLPVGVYHVTGQHLDNAYVFMRLADFEAWFGGGYAFGEEESDDRAGRRGVEAGARLAEVDHR